MASGWAGDGAVQDQIDSTIDDAVARARRELPRGESNKFCDECGEPSPEARRHVDFPLPFMTAFRIIFSRTLFGGKSRNMCP